MSSDLCIINREDCENGNMGIMADKKKKKPPVVPLPPLAEFWQKERRQSGITFKEIEAKTGIPDSTVSRWFAGEVADIKASQVAYVSIAMGIPWWKSMLHAWGGTDSPAEPTEEAQRIASIIADEGDLQSLMGNVLELGPRDRRAVRKYIEMLKQDDQNDPQSAQESE